MPDRVSNRRTIIPPMRPFFPEPAPAMPISARPPTGSSAAYHTGFVPLALVTGRAVVEMVSVDDTGLVLGVTGFVENVHAAPVGTPAEQESEMLFGNPCALAGVRVT